MLAEGAECGGSTAGSDEDEEDSETSESSLSYSEDESSNGGQGRGRVRAKIGGASDRYAIGRTGDARIGCAEGLVCATVDLDRKECRPENTEGEERYMNVCSCCSLLPHHTPFPASSLTPFPTSCRTMCAG